MTRREAALAFLQAFCEGRVDQLAPLLAEDLVFEGPFLQADSRESYLRALEADPPEPASFDVLRVFEGEEDVCVFFVHRKGGAPKLMAQWNRFRGPLIAHITLLFDGRELESPAQ